MKIYYIEGKNFETLDDFYTEVTDKIIEGAPWGRNLDAFNDILSGGYGTPDEGFEIVWKNSDISRKNLGYKETLKWLNRIINTAHPSNLPHIRQKIIDAQKETGPTLFDILVDIIKGHQNISLHLD